MLLSDMDFNFAHFANFNFTYFEIKEIFGLILVKLQNCSFPLKIFISGFYKMLVLDMGFIFAYFVYKGSLEQNWVKIQNDQ